MVRTCMQVEQAIVVLPGYRIYLYKMAEWCVFKCKCNSGIHTICDVCMNIPYANIPHSFVKISKEQKTHKKKQSNKTWYLCTVAMWKWCWIFAKVHVYIYTIPILFLSFVGFDIYPYIAFIFFNVFFIFVRL